jgi:hypothetical protein
LIEDKVMPKTKSEWFCTIEDCQGLKKPASGLCNKHYQQKRRRERGIKPADNMQGWPLEDRLDACSKYNEETECIEWTSTLDRKGYGQLWWDGSTKLAHRLAYELVNGSIDKGLSVLHRCDNRRCINPKHHFLGTKTDNNRDRHTKGRSAKGSGHGRSKFTEETIIKIRSDERICAEIAHDYGVSPSTIERIVNRVSWTHI